VLCALPFLCPVTDKTMSDDIVNKLLKKVEELTAEVKALRAENKELKNENQELKDEVQELKDDVQRLRAENQELKIENQELKDKVQRLQNELERKGPPNPLYENRQKSFHESIPVSNYSYHDFVCLTGRRGRTMSTRTKRPYKALSIGSPAEYDVFLESLMYWALSGALK
jgi:FtsZ-binding cell division protein ZapB